MYKEELTSAIENEDFKVYLQPQVRCEDGLVKGAEALVRWEHRKLGLIPPGDFIEFFEQNGLITELDMCGRKYARFLNSGKRKAEMTILQ